MRYDIGVMQKYQDYFKGKKITLMGLGLLGRGVGDAAFLARQGADLIVTDLKDAAELAPSLQKIKKHKNIKFILGRHRLIDFRHRDLIIKAAGIPLDSPFIKEAKKYKIPVVMSTALFAKFFAGQIIGITGTRGKSTVTQLIYEIIAQHLQNQKSHRKVWLGGNIRGVSTLAMLEKAKADDYAVLELDSWQLQGFGSAKISPHLAVFTTFLSDHMNYYKNSMARYLHDKANIFRYQGKNDYLVLGQSVAKMLKAKSLKPKSKVTITSSEDVPKNWSIKIPGQHNLDNIACALAIAKILQIPIKIVKQVVVSFKGIPGRLYRLASQGKFAIYNDTNATTPDATMAALASLSNGQKNIVLIAGGASKGLATDKLTDGIKKHCRAIILLPGTGTDGLPRSIPGVETIYAKDLKEAVKKALNITQANEALLFSPAFASFGLFKNEYDRGDQFDALVKKLA